MTETILTTEAAPTSEGTQTQTTTAPATESGKPVEAVETKDATVTATDVAEKGTETKEAPQGAPEKYEFNLPENSNVNPELLGELEGVAKELNLPQTEAQKLVDLGIKQRDQFVNQQKESIAKMQEDWTKATTTDKEFGGDKLNENLAIAQKALKAFGTPELKSLLIESGLGNNPEIIRAFYRAGLKMKDDTIVPAGTGNVAKSKDAGSILYPNQNS